MQFLQYRIYTPAERQLISYSLELSLLKLEALLLKANFDPNQPRVPKGNSDGGNWTDSSGNRRVNHNNRQNKPKDNNPVRKPRTKLPPYKVSSTPPELPTEKPSKWAGRIRYAARVAKWTVRAGIRFTPVGRLFDVYDAAHWIYDETPYIVSYFDDPKSIHELRDLVSKPEKGYEIHHIVEQTAARRGGYPEDMINSRENMVRIPTFKHHEVTGWYNRSNDDMDGLSPRAYLRGKSWEERLRIGYQVLMDRGVLKP